MRLSADNVVVVFAHHLYTDIRESSNFYSLEIQFWGRGPALIFRNGQAYRGVRQQFVKLGGARGDQVAVVSGIAPGAEVVTSGVFKLRNGASVEVNNEIQPANDPHPSPEDNL